MPAAASTGARRRLPERRTKPSGTWGVWIDARLQAKVWTQKEAFDQLRTRWHELFPWGDTSIDSFRAYIRGNRWPDEAQQAALVELFGGPPPAAGAALREDAPADLTQLYVLLRDQTKAISSLVEALQTAQQERDDLREVVLGTGRLAQANTDRLRVVEDDLKALAAAMRGGGEGHVPPQQTEGSAG